MTDTLEALRALRQSGGRWLVTLAALATVVSPCLARGPYLIPGLAAETIQSQAQVDAIIAQERSRLSQTEESGGATLEEILRQLEETERSAPGGYELRDPSGLLPDAGSPTIDQQVRLGYNRSTLDSVSFSIPTTVESFTQWSLDYRNPTDGSFEIDVNNLLHAGTLKTEDFLDVALVYTPEERVRARFRQHFELQKNAQERITNDYDLTSSELTLDYNFPVRLRALARGFIEDKSFDSEGAFNFNSRTKQTEFYLERPYMNGTFTANLINEAQFFDSDPLSNFKRQTLTLTSRGRLTSRVNGEIRFVRERQDRAVPAEALDYDDDSWIFLVDYRFTDQVVFRMERDLENRVYSVPDDINFNFRRNTWRPSITYLPSAYLTLILDTALETRRNFESDSTDLILEKDEDFDVSTLSLTTTYVRDRIFATITLLRSSFDHLLPDNPLLADLVSSQISGTVTYNVSSSKALSVSYSRVNDEYVAVAAANNSLTTILTADMTYRF